MAFKEIVMKTLLTLSITVAATIGSLTGVTAQQDQPFCLREGDGTLTCHFQTMEQCQEALKKGPTRTGTCIANPKLKR